MKLEQIKYSTPLESVEQDELPRHRFEVVVDGVQIGGAEVEYFSKPLPLYQVTELYVDFAHKGKGYASQIMDTVESFLKERKKPGVLVDAIVEDDPAAGMYERRGWTVVPNARGLHVFNWPSDVSLDVLKGYAERYTDHFEREGRKKEGVE